MSLQPISHDELLLARMGYRQEFTRNFKLIHNMGVSLSHLSILGGVTILFGFVLGTGGPGGAVWSWIIVSLMSLAVSSTMAEICSAYPTAGGLYYWSAKLGGEKWGPVFAWYTGWFNFCGQIGAMASGGYGVSQFVWSIVLLYDPEYEVTLWKIALLGIFMMYFAAILNSIHDSVIERVMEISVFLHLVGPVVIIIVVLAMAPTRQSASFVFTQLENQTGQDSQAFAFILGFLLAAWTLMGYDASAHVSEETVSAYKMASRGIVYSVFLSDIFGLILLLGLLFAVQDINAILTAPYPLTITQLFLDATSGNKGVTAFLLVIPAAGTFAACIATITANSRMLYAFCRDSGLGHTLSKFLYWSSKTNRLPLRTIWFGTTLCNGIIAVGFGSSVALNAAASIGTVGLMTCYVIPTFVKLTIARNTFKRGEFHLGPFSEVLGWISVVWVAFLFVILCLPYSYPVTMTNFNYASIMIGGVTIFATLFWLVSARFWFQGPQPHLSEEELAVMEEKVAAFKEQELVKAAESA